MNTVLAVLGFAVGLVGSFLYLITKKDTDKILTDNEKVKNELTKLNQTIQDNKTSLTNEEKVREELKQEIKDVKNENVTSENILQFFNNRK